MRDHAIGHPALTDRPTGLTNRLHFELVYSYLFQAADRIEQAVLELNLGRVSIGLANYEASMKEPSELLETADRVLRAAEEAGGGVELA